MDGLLLVNKPSGISSRKAVDLVIRRLGKVKGGHCGTLDPLADGLLVIGLGRATRALDHLLLQSKCYRAKVRLGMRTDTGDMEGEIVQRQDFQMPDRARLAAVFAALRGEMMQSVPAYSALKQGGKRFYQLARNEEEVPHRQRRVWIYKMQLGETGSDGFSFDVECSRGTYIRSLAEDIGRYLNTVACLERLRRIAIGSFTLERSLSLDAIDKYSREDIVKAILPVDQAFCDLPSVDLDVGLADAFCHGRAVTLGNLRAEKRWRVYNGTKGFLGIAVSDGNILKPLKVLKPAD